MVYQLPNGKVVYITLEQYLRMSEDDVRDMVNSGEGFNSGKEKSFADNSVNDDYEASENDSEYIEEIEIDMISDEDDTDTSGTQLRIRDIKFGTGDIEAE